MRKPMQREKNGRGPINARFIIYLTRVYIYRMTASYFSKTTVDISNNCTQVKDLEFLSVHIFFDMLYKVTDFS